MQGEKNFPVSLVPEFKYQGRRTVWNSIMNLEDSFNCMFYSILNFNPPYQWGGVTGDHWIRQERKWQGHREPSAGASPGSPQHPLLQGWRFPLYQLRLGNQKLENKSQVHPRVTYLGQCQPPSPVKGRGAGGGLQGELKVHILLQLC